MNVYKVEGTKQFDTDEEYEEFLRKIRNHFRSLLESENYAPSQKAYIQKALDKSYTISREEMNKFLREEDVG